MTATASNRDSRQTAMLAAALLVLALHALVYGNWMIDDAGITFAYARNLAAGHGLVAQPGAAPVEGYSNPLWTLVIAVAYALGTFSLAATPKVLAFVLVAGALTLIVRDLRARGASTFALGIPVLLLAACTPFVIWTTSGLENALLVLLVVLACTNTLAAVARTSGTSRRDLAAGAVAALLALTRPDAILYTAAHAVSVAGAEWTRGAGFVTRTIRRWLILAAGLLPIFGSYMAFRIGYFGDVVPNTYHAKQKPSAADLLSPGKLFDLIESATGDFAWVVPFFIAGVLGVLLLRRTVQARTLVFISYLGGGHCVVSGDAAGLDGRVQIRHSVLPAPVLHPGRTGDWGRDGAPASLGGTAPVPGSLRAVRRAGDHHVRVARDRIQRESAGAVELHPAIRGAGIRESGIHGQRGRAFRAHV